MTWGIRVVSFALRVCLSTPGKACRSLLSISGCLLPNRIRHTGMYLNSRDPEGSCEGRRSKAPVSSRPIEIPVPPGCFLQACNRSSAPCSRNTGQMPAFAGLSSGTAVIRASCACANRKTHRIMAEMMVIRFIVFYWSCKVSHYRGIIRDSSPVIERRSCRKASGRHPAMILPVMGSFRISQPPRQQIRFRGSG